MSDPAPGPLFAELDHLLRRAGRLALPHAGRIRPERKHDGSPVTDADRAVEALLTQELSARFPGDGIHGEEGTRSGSAERTWYLDPIDGTSSFVAGLSTWGPTIALVEAGVPIAGAFHVPTTGQTWFAERAGGAWLGSADGTVRRLQCRPVVGDGNDILFVPSGFHRAGPLDWRGKVRALGCTAAHLAHVASGGGVAAVTVRWEVWDVAAGILLVEEASGVARDPQGHPLTGLRPGVAVPFVAGSRAAVDLLTRDGGLSRALRRRQRTEEHG